MSDQQDPASPGGDTPPDTTTSPGRPLTPEHRDYLVDEGIGSEFIDARSEAGLLRSVGDGDALPSALDYSWLTMESRQGILFGTADAAGTVSWQLRPDAPPTVDGRAMKYVGGQGDAGYGVLRQSEAGPVLIVEGTKQVLAAAAALHGDADDELTEVTIIGIQGCWGWSTGGEADPGLVRLCRDREVAVALDADAGTNRRVYEAGTALQESLGGVTKKVEFLRLPGRGKEGLDDLLAALQEGDRRDQVLAWWLARQPKPARKRPSDKTGRGSGSFEAWDPATGKLRVEATADHLIATRHYALAKSQELAAFTGGRYIVAKHQLASDVLDMLGDTYGTGHLGDIKSAVQARTHKLRRTIPEFPWEPYANFRNGLLDLRTLELHPHTPAFFGTRQIPVDWDPDAPADRWVAWAIERMGEDQLLSLEDTVSQILDASTPPSKAPFLYGPTRTGKSTVGRIIAALAGGSEFVSGVPIQKLSDPRYAAMLYGMVVNVCTDLPREAMKDESGFLRMLGGDPMLGDAKYGATFSFVNAALHVFATNTIVTISGDPEPYLDRIAPFALIKSYAGRADPAVEARVLEQLPGICVRLARAWQARYQRIQKREEEAAAGVPESDRTPVWLPGHPAVIRRFADASDRVQRFVATCCDTGVEAMPDVVGLREEGDFSPGPQTKTALYEAFKLWAESEGSVALGMRAFTERLMKLPGVREIRSGAKKGRAVNVGIKPREDWGDAESDIDLLPAIFPDEYPVEPADEQPGPRLVGEEPATVDAQPRLATPTPTPAAPAPTGPAKFTHDELAALRMLAPGTYDAFTRGSKMLPQGANPHDAVATAPVTLLLTDLAETVDMSAERLRALIRRLDPLLYRAGWMIRERWLAEPGVLNSVNRPGFGDRDFGTDRVGYAVVRAFYSTLPHNIDATEEAA
ncbi:DNA primase family protein [Mycobacteroides abscessus]|uniref:DNA primase family protein n=1 Tax=Mycobacteroides abscessus TaxID=36809 RepID=UPI0009287BA5|nr:DNA primase family protein [Mycobacteroides abscessus]MBN7371101.1 DUF3854 domain-containing protein [Mycobacteroides abscessus subsp. abscessus]MBN7522610.1 DUF3854 domain-containing protein [Mycobacteroides abscessus subsp. abscessus]MDB2185163.1 DUF3854 domain-containing protein [Mycobacteroides abscessus subsp. abscessus]MDO3123484.1 DUF3854 domain-containing protein [Mycobacteroides abscessus subsp. abscessus]MDO3173295.1 DUF3854 domain-containing protein [Mycobacteroides abscessus sub